MSAKLSRDGKLLSLNGKNYVLVPHVWPRCHVCAFSVGTLFCGFCISTGLSSRTCEIEPYARYGYWKEVPDEAKVQRR